MAKNNFWADDEWQRQKRDKYLSGFYGKFSRDGRYVYIEKSRCSTLMQKRLAVDTIVQSRRGGSECVEEKIVRAREKPLTAFCLETESCTVAGHESDGWMKYGEADYLMYCFEVETSLDLDCYLMEFQPLKAWFWAQDIERFHRHVMPTLNRTASRLVPVVEVARNIKAVRFLMAPGGLMQMGDPLIPRDVFKVAA